MGLAVTLLPLIPGLVSGLLGLIDSIKNHPDTPDAVKAQLGAISDKLDETAALVAGLEIRDEQK